MASDQDKVQDDLCAHGRKLRAEAVTLHDDDSGGIVIFTTVGVCRAKSAAWQTAGKRIPDCSLSPY